MRSQFLPHYPPLEVDTSSLRANEHSLRRAGFERKSVRDSCASHYPMCKNRSDHRYKWITGENGGDIVVSKELTRSATNKDALKHSSHSADPLLSNDKIKVLNLLASPVSKASSLLRFLSNNGNRRIKAKLDQVLLVSRYD